MPGEPAKRHDADAVGGPWGHGPGAVHAPQRPDRDPGPALCPSSWRQPAIAAFVRPVP
jgi:hypothetical protein